MLRKWANWFGLKYEQVDKKEASATSNPDELYKYNTCSKEFNCGNITGVSYPFWGSDRPLGCGHLDLQLNCHDGIATIEIMGVNYRVLSFNKDAQTLRIARQDYLKGICSPLLVNTTLDPKLFDYAAVYQYVTFFYGCPYSLAISVMPQKFSCSIAGIPLKDGYFVASPQPQGPGPCNVSVFVPILSTSILEGIGKFQNLDQLIEGVIGEGIEVRLNVDGTACSECLESKGVCGYDLGLNQTTCYCKDQLQASKTCGSPTGEGPSPESSPPSTCPDHQIQIMTRNPPATGGRNTSSGGVKNCPAIAEPSVVDQAISNSITLVGPEESNALGTGDETITDLVNN
ncbi:Leaf rust 10 disease resistance locus receptor-like protein kinase-like 2.4 [Vitis vinifera]|uniref:non-specific serine/threonine protein kinase n=1 Tax=Vitis vinifera TaxID=29760 RepID=A0A438G972_VITVI|nr:Leaf rust 10 disease resistance locus receptor-like protein kinase-like 2.4 [Vitis vinifera]